MMMDQMEKKKEARKKTDYFWVRFLQGEKVAKNPSSFLPMIMGVAGESAFPSYVFFSPSVMDREKR